MKPSYSKNYLNNNYLCSEGEVSTVSVCIKRRFDFIRWIEERLWGKANLS